MTSKDLIAGRGISRVIVTSVGAMLVAVPARTSAQNIVPSVTHSWLAAERAASTTLGLFGDVTNCTLIRCEQSAALGLSARIAGPFRATSGVVLQQDASPVLGARQALVRTDLFYESGSATAWLGHLAGKPNGPQSVRAELMPGFESGFVYRWRSVGLTTLASMGMTRARIPENDGSFARDSAAGDTMSTRSFTTEVNRWTSAEARLTWRQDRWWVSALLGRISMTQTGASLWGGFQAGADLGRGATLLAGIGASSRLRTAGGTDVARRNVSLGLGFNTSILSSRPEASQPPVTAASFTLSHIATGKYRIAVRSVSGHIVEFASDCTGWKPVMMTHDHDAWIVELPILVGPHRANIRVDGGAWIAPPGLMTADDDFAGHVGLFVVE